MERSHTMAVHGLTRSLLSVAVRLSSMIATMSTLTY